MTIRTTRTLAASTLLALAVGASLGSTTAGAVSASPSPTATASPTVSAAPSASAAPTASPSATAGATTSAPTSHPSAPLPSPGSSDPQCVNGVGHDSLKVTGTGLWGTTLVKGGPAQEITTTWENTSGVDIAKFATYLYLTEEEPTTPIRPFTKDLFEVQVRTPGTDWKPAYFNDSRSVDTGTHAIAKGGKLTVSVRITATTKLPTGPYGGNQGGASEVFDNSVIPHPTSTQKYSCTQYTGYYEGRTKVSDTADAATATPGTVKPTTTAGPGLAETGGSSSTLPIAAAGAVVLAAGAGTLLVLRRRKAAHQ
ncbi:LAETG motif-containing sortase-dependent surface protein [Kitasatospora indigofera]|uniref:LAETG motif-containing sortase-dependent surface protein n=1 Tax=Kitasatospora indigofera TaxID=67307 RepID=UPI0036327071